MIDNTNLLLCYYLQFLQRAKKWGHCLL